MSKPKQAPKPEVLIRVTEDRDASRISAVLEALGYDVVRQLERGDAGQRLRWSVDRLARRHNLTTRERHVLAGVLAGLDNAGLANDLMISRATVKWHLHNVFAKTDVGSREELLRLALQLGTRRTRDEGGGTPSPGDPEAEAPVEGPAEAGAKAEV